MTLYEILKARKTGLSPDLFTSLISKNHNPPKRKYVSVTGIPPLKLFGSAGANLVDWLIEGDTVQNGTPSPENPVEVKGVGDRTGNLFNKNDVTFGYGVNDNTGFLVASVAETCASGYIYIKDTEKIYIKIYNATPMRQWAAFYDSEKKYISGFNGYDRPITVPTNAYYLRLTSNAAYNDSLMLNEGSEPLQYEPYGYKIPVVSRGKNLFTIPVKYGINISTGLVDTNENRQHGEEFVLVESNAKYIFSKQGQTTSRVLWVLAYDKDKNPVKDGEYNPTNKNALLSVDMSTTASTFTFYTTPTTKYIRWYITAGIDNWDEIKAQIERGDTATEYEPYRTPIISTQYLSTPLMKDERLTPTAREVKWGVKVFDGSENITITARDPNVSKDYLRMVYNTTSIIAKAMETPYCSHFVRTTVFAYSAVSVAICKSDNSKHIEFCISKNEHSSVDDFKVWLKSEYDAGHPVTVWYQLATPTTEPITTTPIGTLDGECWIDMDTEIRSPYMETTYVTNADDSAEINEQSEENKEVIADEHQFPESGTGSFE